MRKRILAVVLCVAMLLSVVPFTLSASASDTVDDTAKNILTVPAAGGTINHSKQPWGLGQHTTTGLFQNWTSVTENGENFFAKQFPADYEFATKGVNKYNITFLPATYENGGARDGSEDTIGQLYDAESGVDLTKYTAIAVRFKTTGGNPATTSRLRMSQGTGNAINNPVTLTGLQLWDYTTGNLTTITSTTDTYLTVPYNFDGWFIIPSSMWLTTLDAMTRVGFALWQESNAANWDGKTIYFGDMKIVENVEAFKRVNFVPSFEAEATNTSITVTSTDTDAVYSLNKDAEASDWLALDAFNATLVNLTKDTKYTINAKYLTGTKIATKEVWTSPYSTHNGDGASYFLNVYDDVENYFLRYDYYNQATNPVGYPAKYSLAKAAADNGTYDDGAHNGGLFVRKINGETFIEFDKAEYSAADAQQAEGVAANGCVNQSVNINVITYGGHIKAGDSDTVPTTTGIHSSIDKTNLKYAAVRLKIANVNDLATAVSAFSLYVGGTREADLSNAYLIDINGKITDPEWTEWLYEFDGEFDGWVVVPFEAYGENGKNLWTESSASISLYLHDNNTANCASNHGKTDSNWDNKILYVGDILVVEDEKQFKSVHVCGAAGHTEDAGVSTAATCTADGYTTYTCSVCDNVRIAVDEGSALNHKNATTDEKAVTCYEDGYKKVYCPDCKTTIEDVKYTTRPPHTPSATPEYKAPTCYEDGSTGDIICAVCAAAGIRTVMTAGTPISKDTVQHTPSAERVGKVDATCTKKGHEGNIICTVCADAGYETIMTAGKETDMLPHEKADKLANVAEATCSKKGYSGDEVCKDCGFVMKDGKETDMLPHKEADARVDVVEAKCGVAGYTGDKVCKDCGATMEEGKEIPALEHKEAAELKDKKDPTATEKGYTGDKVCELCGATMEAGKEIPATGTATTPDDDKTEGDNTTGGDNTDDDNAGAGSEDDGALAPETGDNASVLVAVLVALMAGAAVVLAKKRAIEK